MPPRIPTGARSLSAALEPYVCLSCQAKSASESTSAARLRPAQKSRSRDLGHGAITRSLPRTASLGTKPLLLKGRSAPQRRYASTGTLASTTAINAPSTVPPAYADLHEQLLRLEHTASSYVDISRIQLAARSLESSRPVVRIALCGLGSNGAAAARKLAKVLLGDALGQEEAWERNILESSQDGRALLLRYGDVEDVVPQSPLVRTMHVPSLFLQRHRLEILLTTLHGSATHTNGTGIDLVGLEQAVLVPTLSHPNAAGGGVAFVRYPVHKALVVAEGISGAIEYGRLPQRLRESGLVNAALSLPLREASSPSSAEEAVSGNVIDIDLATHALSLFRDNKANGAQFSHEWETSRVSALSEWLAGPKTTEDGLHPAVRALIASVLSTTGSSINYAISAEATRATSTTISEATRQTLHGAITTWSASAHRDLSLNLTTALNSHAWRRTAWFRLLWRIDDVSISCSEILTRSWLTEAEQSLAFLSGRILEAGLATPDQLKATGAEAILAQGVEAHIQGWEQVGDVTRKPGSTISGSDLLEAATQRTHQYTLVSSVQQASGVNALFDPPWPQTIHLNRQLLLHTLVPSLHRRAQGLLVATLSTAGASAALGAWLFVATSGIAVYEAGAVAALGLVWSLRRLQRLWGKERTGFEGKLREDGRVVLKAVEEHVNGLVERGGRIGLDKQDMKVWEEARAGVQKCKKSLGDVV